MKTPTRDLSITLYRIYKNGKLLQQGFVEDVYDLVYVHEIERSVEVKHIVDLGDEYKLFTKDVQICIDFDKEFES